MKKILFASIILVLVPTIIFVPVYALMFYTANSNVKDYTDEVIGNWEAFQYYYGTERVVCDETNNLILEITDNESWMKRYTDLLEQKAYPSVEEAFESSVNSENEAREIIEVGERFIDIISTAQTNRILLKRKYRQMIFLDALVGQVDRTLGNYGLIYDEIEHQYSFAPLFDNATLRKPYTGFGICLVNGFVAERKYVLKILLEDKKILSMAKLLIENKFQIIPSLLKIAAEWLEPKQYDLLISNFFFGLFVLEALIIKK